MCIDRFRGYKTSTGRNAASRFSLMAHTSGEGKAMQGDGSDGSTSYIRWGVANLHDMIWSVGAQRRKQKDNFSRSRLK